MTIVDGAEHALQRTDGMLEASVSYAVEQLRLEFDSRSVDTKGARATATVLNARAKEIFISIPLARTFSRVPAPAPGTKGLVTLTVAGKASKQVRFAPMARETGGEHKGHKQ